MARKSLERMFSPPPRWSVTGMALLWKARSSSGPRRICHRDERDREQAGVGGAEPGDSLVLRGAAGVQAVQVGAEEHGRGERREHQLTVKAEQVQHAAALDGI